MHTAVAGTTPEVQADNSGDTSVVKHIARIVGLLRSTPHLLGFTLARSLLDEQRAFIGASEHIARLPGHIGIYARQAFYKRLLADVGHSVYFGFMSVFSRPQATVGDRVYIGRFCSIGWAHLGDDVMLADGVQILSGRHQHSGTQAENAHAATWRDQAQHFSKVTIGAGAWIGAGAIVMADVGQGAVVGAGAVVLRDVPSGAKVGGIPAKSLNR